MAGGHQHRLGCGLRGRAVVAKQAGEALVQAAQDGGGGRLDREELLLHDLLPADLLRLLEEDVGDRGRVRRVVEPAAALARNLARQIRTKDEADVYRERVRLRGLEDELLARIPLEEPLEASLAANLKSTMNLVQATGAAVVRGDKISTCGVSAAPATA